MDDPRQAIQGRYTEQLQKYYAQRYRAYALNEEAEDPSNELGRSAVPIPRKDLSELPAEVHAAHAFYWNHFEQEDIGSARVWRFAVRRKTFYAVMVTTDGDDGYAEFYDAKGNFLAAARRYLEVVAWGSRDWLRGQAEHPSELPPELQDAHQRTLWGRPLAGIHCGETCDHACTATPPGGCIGMAGHLAADGSPHRCCQCGHNWGGTPTPPEPPAPAIAPWLVEARSTEGPSYDEWLLVTEITIDTDDGPVTVPVGDVLQIDFAPRKGGKRSKKSSTRDAITTADAELTGTIQGDRFTVQFPGYTTNRMYSDTTRIVNRVTPKDAAGAFGTRREFRLRGRGDGLVTGSNPYTLDSCLATAAVHAGVLKEGEPGVVRVEIVQSPPAFKGSERNGITSETWDEANEEGAYRILKRGGK